ncbi:MAG: helix-turn-helix transcriptional regulator [Roseibacillus sp.]
MSFDALTDFVDLALVGGCALVVSQLLLGGVRGVGRLPLLLMFLGIFVAQSSGFFLPLGWAGWSDAALLLGQAGQFLALGALFIYVRVMTASEPLVMRSREYWHLWPIPLAIAAALPVLFLGSETRYELMRTGDAESSLAFRSVMVLLLAEVLWVIWSIPILWSSGRRLLRYRSRLKEVHSSSENREMIWMSALIGALGLFWVTSLIDVLGYFGFPWKLGEGFELLVNFLVIWIPALWGLRQKPGLWDVKSDISADGIEGDEGVNGGSSRVEEEVVETVMGVQESSEKYQNSGLGDERAERIAAKLEKVMAEDSLFLDPDLSLGKLANHLGVRPNYLSQSLNTVMGESFFGYVNRLRAREAEKALRESDETVLQIAYDSGFNSRSSFYTTFKKHFDCSPSAYRKKHQ